ncbi:MAG: hypothetical protein AVDCRST_MAG56-5192 [uncultured Cytophagales bacterium]|uniref:O-antigen ligase-related domain-containing protein n=1 Tax=uncultured Cytophagales bacterium TaxID=158755 RepID=A0A6J4K9C2_9SPHI|nr:MAG: hypothetical protein AVDCRST_MAG56-5192 [uncultured Cytophagales bacterium]
MPPEFSLRSLLPPGPNGVKRLYPAVYFYALLLIVVTMPYAYAVNSTTAFILAGFWLLGGDWAGKWQRLRRRPLAWLFMAPYLMEILGMLYTHRPAEGLFVLQKKVLLFAFPLLLATIPPLSRRQVRHVLLAFVASCVAGSLYCLGSGLYYALVLGQPDRLFYHELARFINMQGIYLSLYTGFCILVLVHCVLHEWQTLSPAFRRAALATAVYLTGFTVLLSVRTALAALAFLGAGLLLRFFYVHRRLAVGLAAITAALLLLAGLLYLNPVSKQKFAEAFSTGETIPLHQATDQSLGRNWGGKALRFAIWQCTANVVRQRPLFGVGTGSTQDALQAGYKACNFDFAYRFNRYNAHNQFLETWVGLGLAGLTLLLAALLVPLYRALRAAHYLYVLLIVFFAINSLTESTLERQKGVLFYAFFNALLAFHGHQDSAREVTRRFPES